MRAVFLARPRYEYGSYTYYFRLAALSGIPVCYVDEIDLESNAVYVVSPMNGEFVPHMQHRTSLLGGRPRNAVVIWWNIERPGGELVDDPTVAALEFRAACAWATKDFVDEIWSHDRYFTSLLPGARCVPIGSDERLRVGTPVRPHRYDVCHFMYINHRRSQILGGLENAGLRIGPPGWDEARDNVWNSSRALVNIHQSGVLGGEQLRFAAAAAWMMPILSETFVDPWPLEPGKDILMGDYGGFVGRAHQWLQGNLEGIGELLWKKLTQEYTFRDCILEGVSQTLKAIGDTK